MFKKNIVKWILTFGCLTIATKLQFSNEAPLLLEAGIHAKESTVKITRPSKELLAALESKFDVPVIELFELPQLRHIPELNLAAIDNTEDLINGVLASKGLIDTDSFLMAPIALPSNIMERLLTDDLGAYLQILLPGHEKQPAPIKLNDTSSDEEQPAVMITREPSPEENMNKFYQQFLKIDLNSENKYIPNSVRIALQNVQQVLIHPKTFLHVPEGRTNSSSQVFTITSATPVDVILGLFESIK